jgi:hypothetical protein
VKPIAIDNNADRILKSTSANLSVEISNEISKAKVEEVVKEKEKKVNICQLFILS